MENKKLNTLLAKTDHLANSFKAAIGDYIRFFKEKQSSFRGDRKTYSARPGTMDDPSKRGNKLIVTTVDEKLKWLSDGQKEYIDALFSQEATNASGKARAELKVGEKSFGTFSSLELLRLKSILENGSLEEMYGLIPVRNDDELWTETKDEMYKDKKTVYESELSEGIVKTTEKEQYVMVDPNIEKVKGNYTPVVGVKNTVIELGDATHQKFTGEWSHRQRAELLQRRTKLLSAVIEALKVANEAEAVESDMNAEKLFGYLHYGS